MSFLIQPVASVAQFVLSGPWITVETQSGVVVDQPQHPECLVVTARNSGRMAATVEQWGFVIKGTLHGPTGWTNGTALPYRLEPHGAPGRWILDYHEARASLVQNYPRKTSHFWDLVPYVRVSGTGKFKYGRNVLKTEVAVSGALGKAALGLDLAVAFVVYQPCVLDRVTGHRLCPIQNRALLR